jgi:hypothetical protein
VLKVAQVCKVAHDFSSNCENKRQGVARVDTCSVSRTQAGDNCRQLIDADAWQVLLTKDAWQIQVSIFPNI